MFLAIAQGCALFNAPDTTTLTGSVSEAKALLDTVSEAAASVSANGDIQAAIGTVSDAAANISSWSDTLASSLSSSGASSGAATDTTLSLLGSLKNQLANVQFEGALMYVVLMLLAGLICMEGYGISRMALAAIGFVVGFTRVTPYIARFNLSTEHTLMVRAGAGLLLGALSMIIIQIGVFIAVYNFVQKNLSVMLVSMLAEKITLPDFVYPLFSALAGAAIAFLIAKLATKFVRPIIVVVTAVIGGFAAVDFFLKMVPLFPVNMNFLPPASSPLWVFVKVGIAAAGAGVQGVIKKDTV